MRLRGKENAAEIVLVKQKVKLKLLALGENQLQLKRAREEGPVSLNIGFVIRIKSFAHQHNCTVICCWLMNCSNLTFLFGRVLIVNF